jgi:PST family polysaccharide transporter
MLGKLKNNTLVANVFYLSWLQGANYLLPLISLPFLVRVLGVEKFGLVSFAQAFVQYFIVFTDYGFNMSATREVSQNKNDNKKISEIFCSVMLIKFIIAIISIILMTLIILFVEKFKNDSLLYFLTFGVVLGNILSPIWFFMGMEKMKYVTIFNVFSKLLFTLLIFAFINNKDDYLYVPIFNSFGFIFVGIISLLFCMKFFNLEINFPSFHSVKFRIIDGWNLFVTSILTSILSMSGIFVLGIFHNNEVVGAYSAIEKLIKAFTGLFKPITQSLFPYISTKFGISFLSGLSAVLKSGKIILIIALSLCILIFTYSKSIILLVYGSNYVDYSALLSCLSVWMLFGVINNVLGIQFLVASGRADLYNRCFVASALLTIVIFLTSTSKFSYYGVVAGMLSGEICLTLLMTYIVMNLLSKNNVLISRS